MKFYRRCQNLRDLLVRATQNALTQLPPGIYRCKSKHGCLISALPHPRLQSQVLRIETN